MPLRLQAYRLSSSMIAKLLPRERVVRRAAAIALPGAAWEGSCYYVDARDPLADWRRDGAAHLGEAMVAGLTTSAPSGWPSNS